MRMPFGQTPKTNRQPRRASAEVLALVVNERLLNAIEHAFPDRNLTDGQLLALARKGGVAQVTLYEGFLRADGKASILDAVEHIRHMVRVMGIEHVGIGTDFDGDGGVPRSDSISINNYKQR